MKKCVNDHVPSSFQEILKLMLSSLLLQKHTVTNYALKRAMLNREERAIYKSRGKETFEEKKYFRTNAFSKQSLN